MHHQVKTIDANIFISYLSDNRTDRGLKSRIKDAFTKLSSSLTFAKSWILKFMNNI